MLCSWEILWLILYQNLVSLLYYRRFHKDCFKILPIMLALCLMLSGTYYAQNYGGIIGLGLTLSTIQLNVWTADNFITADIFFLLVIYNIISLTALTITLPWCLLLSFLHNKIHCKQNAWAVDNLAPLDMPFVSIIA